MLWMLYERIISFLFFVQQFEVQATDMGSPPRISAQNAQVTVTVIRNTQPFFSNTNSYAVTIPETHPEGTSVYSVTFNDNDRDVRITFLFLK